MSHTLGASLSALLVWGFPVGASAQSLARDLTPPTAPMEHPTRLRLEPALTQAPSFGALYGSAWAGWGAGLGIGAGVGLVGGVLASAGCAADPGSGWTCPLLVVGSATAGGISLGMLIGAGVGVWRAGDEHGGGGEGWLAMVGAIALPAVLMGLAGLITLGLEPTATATTMSAATFASSVLAPQLGATLFYELSRSF